MFCILDDIGVVEVSVQRDGNATTINVKGFDGDFWKELLPKMLSSTDPNAAKVVSELLMWLDANDVKDESTARTGRRFSDGNCDSSTCVVRDSEANNSSIKGSGVYMDAFDETLKNFKDAQGVRMVQAMAGSVPILIYKTITDTYCFSFPPETMVYTMDDVKEMARTGRYTFGKRYMDTLLEVLDASR